MPKVENPDTTAVWRGKPLQTQHSSDGFVSGAGWHPSFDRSVEQAGRGRRIFVWCGLAGGASPMNGGDLPPKAGMNDFRASFQSWEVEVRSARHTPRIVRLDLDSSQLCSGEMSPTRTRAPTIHIPIRPVESWRPRAEQRFLCSRRSRMQTGREWAPNSSGRSNRGVAEFGGCRLGRVEKDGPAPPSKVKGFVCSIFPGLADFFRASICDPRWSGQGACQTIHSIYVQALFSIVLCDVLGGTEQRDLLRSPGYLSPAPFPPMHHTAQLKTALARECYESCPFQRGSQIDAPETSASP